MDYKQTQLELLDEIYEGLEKHATNGSMRDRLTILTHIRSDIVIMLNAIDCEVWSDDYDYVADIAEQTCVRLMLNSTLSELSYEIV